MTEPYYSSQARLSKFPKSLDDFSNQAKGYIMPTFTPIGILFNAMWLREEAYDEVSNKINSRSSSYSVARQRFAEESCPNGWQLSCQPRQWSSCLSLQAAIAKAWDAGNRTKNTAFVRILSITLLGENISFDLNINNLRFCKVRCTAVCTK